MTPPPPEDFGVVVVVGGLLEPLEPEPEVELDEDELPAEVELAWAAILSCATVTGTPTPSSPFIPAAACPLTVQRNSYSPFFEKVTVSVADWPWWRTAVALPTHAFFAAEGLATGVVQTLKLWKATPRFVTLNVTVPVGIIEVFESLKASSDGFPGVTVITEAFTATVRCAAGAAPLPNAATIPSPAATEPPSAGTASRKGRRLIVFSRLPSS